MVYQADKKVTVAPHTSVQPEEMSFTLLNPRLWNGREDPFMYQTVITLVKDGKEIDKVEQPLGLRYYATDADRGFFLNGNICLCMGCVVIRSGQRWEMHFVRCIMKKILD